MKKIIPFWERIIYIGTLLLVFGIIWTMESEARSLGRISDSEDVRMYIFLLTIVILSIINFFLLFIEYDEENDYICYSVWGRKFKARLSDVAYVGFLPFGVDGTYEIKYGTEKSFPFFCLFNKKKMLELYEAVKKKNPDCVYGF